MDGLLALMRHDIGADSHLGVKPIRGGPAVDRALITAIGAFEQ